MVEFTVIHMVVVVFLSVAVYNFIELNVQIFATFKRRSGLYFWSFTIATWGILSIVPVTSSNTSILRQKETFTQPLFS